VLLLPALKRGEKNEKERGASLVDLGDGVLCLEFHSKMNTIGAIPCKWCTRAESLGEGFDALVIGNQAPNFCVGANLMLILTAIQEGDWTRCTGGARLSKCQHGAEVRAQTVWRRLTA